MRKFFVIFLCCVLVFSITLSVSAASDFVYHGAVSFEDGYDYDTFTSVTNSLGDTVTDFIISPNQHYYFQLWHAEPHDTWADYMGSFWNETPPFMDSAISGRVRPFGNTDLNIGTGGFESIDTGYYMPLDVLSPGYEVTFNFGFNIQDVDHMGGMLPPLEGLHGYLYIFYLHRAKVGDEVTLMKVGYPITYDFTYYDSTYSASFLCSKTINMQSYIRDPQCYGFIPLFTFYALDTNNYNRSIFFPYFEFSTSSSYMQNVLDDIDDLLHGTLKPDNFDSDNLIGGVNDIISGMDSFVSDQLSSIQQFNTDSQSILQSFSRPLLVTSQFLNLLFEIDFFNKVLVISLSLGAISALLGIISAADRAAHRKDRSNNKGG